MPVSDTLDMVKKGLTAAQIKWIALILMTVDHLGAFGFEIPAIIGAGTIPGSGR